MNEGIEGWGGDMLPNNTEAYPDKSDISPD